MSATKVLIATALMVSVAGAAFAVNLNEIRIDQPGGDVDEYVELAGTPGESLDNIYYIVIGDGTDVGAGGGVEEITDLTGNAIQADGFFLIAEATFTLPGTVDLFEDINFENSDNVTHLLVMGLNPAVNVGSGFGGSDLDVDDDGVIDADGDWDGDGLNDGPPFMSVIDCVALVETFDIPASGELIYCDNTVGPDGTFVPGHVYLCDGSWVIGPFDPVGGDDTPDGQNACPVPVESTTWGKVKSQYR
jgi:hypothetical protein